MTAAATLARARETGLHLAAERGYIHWRGPVPSPDLLAELRAHKASIMALLASETRTTEPDQTIVGRSLDAGTLECWAAELAQLLARTPGQRILNPVTAGAYFAGEARRRLAAVAHDRDAAEALMAFWRQARGQSAGSLTPMSTCRPAPTHTKA